VFSTPCEPCLSPSDKYSLLTATSSSGLLLYAALVDLLAEDFLSEDAQQTLRGKDKKMAFGFVLLGGKWMALVYQQEPGVLTRNLAAAMSIVGAFA